MEVNVMFKKIKLMSLKKSLENCSIRKLQSIYNGTTDYDELKIIGDFLDKIQGKKDPTIKPKTEEYSMLNELLEEGKKELDEMIESLDNFKNHQGNLKSNLNYVNHFKQYIGKVSTVKDAIEMKNLNKEFLKIISDIETKMGFNEDVETDENDYKFVSFQKELLKLTLNPLDVTNKYTFIKTVKFLHENDFDEKLKFENIATRMDEMSENAIVCDEYFPPIHEEDYQIDLMIRKGELDNSFGNAGILFNESSRVSSTTYLELYQTAVDMDYSEISKTKKSTESTENKEESEYTDLNSRSKMGSSNTFTRTVEVQNNDELNEILNINENDNNVYEPENAPESEKEINEDDKYTIIKGNPLFEYDDEGLTGVEHYEASWSEDKVTLIRPLKWNVKGEYIGDQIPEKVLKPEYTPEDYKFSKWELENMLWRTGSKRTMTDLTEHEYEEYNDLNISRFVPHGSKRYGSVVNGVRY